MRHLLSSFQRCGDLRQSLFDGLFDPADWAELAFVVIRRKVYHLMRVALNAAAHITDGGVWIS
jgi:hypothetical protein